MAVENFLVLVSTRCDTMLPTVAMVSCRSCSSDSVVQARLYKHIVSYKGKRFCAAI